jgi:hypothetical protein
VLKGRFKPEYAASLEVMALLRRGSDVELRNRRQSQTRSSVWPALGAKLEALAHAYGLAWPVESMTVQAKVKESLTKLSLPSGGLPAWQGIESGNEALARAYELPKP